MKRSPDDLDATTLAVRGLVVPQVSGGSFVLEVVQGPDRGKRFTVEPTDPGPTLVGHGSACGVLLSDRMVSRRHAQLERVGTSLRVTDLDSRNGTRVNGVRIVEALLSGGESVHLGETTLQVTLDEAVASPALPPDTSFGDFIGASVEMRRLYPLLRRLAASTVPVIIEGETGTGKEVLAQALHQEGARSQKPFVVLDCTCVAPSMMEATLFGHERGAFTGAVAGHKGLFEEADGGTLLIDEIGDLDLALQPKLLRAIERSEVRRVGGQRVVKVDVRIIAATRRDLDREIQAGRFRDDLFHRMAVGRVHLPPLRRRKGDVTLLARHFCESQGESDRALPAGLLARWEDYGWPGNTRELRNAVARYLALGEVDAITASPSHLPTTTDDHGLPDGGQTLGSYVDRALQAGLPLSDARRTMVQDFDRTYLERVFEEQGGNATRAAEFLGVARRYFHMIRARGR